MSAGSTGTRSWATSESARRVMVSNRGRDTVPEVRLRSALHARGMRFRKNLQIRTPSQLVRPDVVFTRARVAVFMDGCFWHACPEHGTSPAANAEYWRSKLQRNIERDRTTNIALVSDGWKVLRLWEHEVYFALDDAVERIRALVEETQPRTA